MVDNPGDVGSRNDPITPGRAVDDDGKSLYSLARQILDSALEHDEHFHTNEKWMGVAAVPSGETHVADRLGPGIAAFALVSGNDAFGAWVQILGSSDTPIQSNKNEFDAHRVLVTTTDSTSPFLIQVAKGESADLAAKIAAEEFTEVPHIAATNNADSGISDMKFIRADISTKVWARVICIGQTTKTINFYYGVHEYIDSV